MKVDRRSFLSFIIGGAAGTALSPLPWKLTDDSSIWTQRWPWTPIPANGEIRYVKSTCLLCPGGCGIRVKKVDERVIKIEGLPEHPVNDGGICPLGAAAAQLLYAPTRVRTPMKKVDGRWRRIGWAAALDEVGAALGQLRDSGQSHTVAAICGTDRGTVAELFKRFLTVFGSPNFIRMPSIQDNYELALYLTQGVRAMPGFDLAKSDLVLSFGSGVIEGWMSPGYMLRSKSELTDNGGRFVQIESRLSKTAAKADSWVPINPGTEGALALGIARVLLKNGAYSRVAGYAEGFQSLRQSLETDFGPERVAELTGVDASLIAKLAQQFATAKRPLAICGRGGQEGTPGAAQEFLAVHFLNALAGSINRSGGIWAVPEPEYIEWPEPEMDAAASTGMQVSRLDGAGTERYPQARYLMNRLAASINDSQNPPVQLLFVSGANPVYSLTDTEALKKAFEKIPLVVSFSSFMDETAQAADLILPNHMALERYEDVPAAAGFPKPILGLARPAVAPQYNTRHVGDVIIELAKRQGGPVADAFAWDSYETCLAETLSGQWADLLEAGYAVEADFAPLPLETASGRFEFSNRDISALPAYSSPAAEGDASSFPLVLIPYSSMRLPAGYIGAPPFLVKATEDTILKGNDVLVEMNPETAAGMKVADGKPALLETPRGEARVRIRYDNGIMPGVVALPRGLGHTAYDRFLADKGVNVNRLMASVEDPGTGFDAAWGIRAKISRI
jgi:anaerobic selenocysteine-containing dehydrogenase